MFKKILDLLKDVVINEDELRQYRASMMTKDGVSFSVTVRAYSTADALRMIENDVAEGCIMMDIEILDTY
jgi:ferredoxin-fold anticodon binding domain-containing protein